MDNIRSVMIRTPQEVMHDLAAHAKAKRLALALTQKGLEMRSGVSLGTIKRFERTGNISLDSLLKLAVALGEGEEFDSLFAKHPVSQPPSIEDLLKQPNMRKRGSVT
jgi:transcriptional regulator with XRE-family HTH domain